ncbi:MAG: CoxG family protein [Flavobacteriaceae bacterium]
MKITGERLLNANTATVWRMVLDPDVLEKVTPGIKKLEAIGADSYHALSQVRVGPVKGEFKGKLTITDKVDGKSCRLVIDQKSTMGHVVAEIDMQLNPTEEDNTHVTYTGEAKMSGMLARMGQRIMGGVVSTLSKQFFEALEKEMENNV